MRRTALNCQHAARPRLGLLRVSWAALAFGLLGLFVVSLPLAFLRLSQLDFAPLQYGSVTWTTETQQAAMALLKLSAWGYAFYEIALTTTTTLIFWAIAALMIWRRPGEPFVYLVSVLLLLMGVNSTPIRLAALWPGAEALMELKNSLAWPLLLPFGYLFPSGRWVPRWAGWPVAGTMLIMFAGSRLRIETGPAAGLIIAMVLTVGIGAVAAQFYRYWRYSGAVERQQTKWVVVGFALFWACSLATVGRVDLGHPLYFDLLNVLGLIFPVMLGIAILRYRLWDIDLIIRRTLIYTVLTGVLALAYLGSVLVLQGAFRALTGQGQNSLVVVLSTLAIAALFGPVRARVQRAIDRRFYRRKYDAARTLSEFGTALRDETDLARLSERLVGVVDETMQPARVSLWLRRPQ